MSGADAGTVVHAYGLVDATCSVQPSAGIDGSDVSVVRVGDLGVLVSEVDAHAYGEPMWRQHADDPQWLGKVAADHHAVLQGLVTQADVLPLRLPSIYPDAESLTESLVKQHEMFRAAFDAVRGHIELGVKAYVVGGGQEVAPTQPPTSGREYLARRSAESASREDARLRRQASVVATHEAMANASTHAIANPPQDATLSGRPEPMILNGAYLVARDDFDTFLALVERLAQDLQVHGISLEVTGPWPPYNFAGPAEPPGATDGPHPDGVHDKAAR